MPKFPRTGRLILALLEEGEEEIARLQKKHQDLMRELGEIQEKCPHTVTAPITVADGPELKDRHDCQQCGKQLLDRGQLSEDVVPFVNALPVEDREFLNMKPDEVIK